MRLIQVLVPDEQHEAVRDLLDEEGIDHVRQRVRRDGEEQWLVEAPVPTDAIGYVLDRLDEAGIEVEEYTVISSLESAMSPRAEALQDRFADDFDPLSQVELRSKARDMSHDTRSFLAMIVLSGIIATAGLLVDSPAVVVGSMVIAPIVGPVLTAAVGATTADREMLVNSLWIQGAGLAAAILSAVAIGYAFRITGFVPATLDITSIELVALRIAPGLLTAVVGVAAGGAAAFGITTKGPTSLIGVMIAAALIPAAATVGIAVVWNEPRIAVGSLALLLFTLIAINVAAFVTLRLFYRPGGYGWLVPADARQRLLVAGTALALVVAVGVVGAASAQQIGFERTVNAEVQSTLDASEYDGLDPVAVRIQFSGAGPFASPETVTVVVSRSLEGDPPSVAGDLDRRIAAATDRNVRTRVRFVEYQYAGD